MEHFTPKVHGLELNIRWILNIDLNPDNASSRRHGTTTYRTPQTLNIRVRIPPNQLNCYCCRFAGQQKLQNKTNCNKASRFQLEIAGCLPNSRDYSSRFKLSSSHCSLAHCSTFNIYAYSRLCVNFGQSGTPTLKIRVMKIVHPQGFKHSYCTSESTYVQMPLYESTCKLQFLCLRAS